MTALVVLAERAVCPQCGAQPWTRCRSRTGGRARTHQDRIRVVHAAWWDGYREAALDSMRDPILFQRYAQRAARHPNPGT